MGPEGIVIVSSLRFSSYDSSLDNFQRFGHSYNLVASMSKHGRVKNKHANLDIVASELLQVEFDRWHVDRLLPPSDRSWIWVLFLSQAGNTYYVVVIDKCLMITDWTWVRQSEPEGRWHQVKTRKLFPLQVEFHYLVWPPSESYLADPVNVESWLVSLSDWTTRSVPWHPSCHSLLSASYSNGSNRLPFLLLGDGSNWKAQELKRNALAHDLRYVLYQIPVV